MRFGKGKTGTTALRIALEELSCQCNITIVGGASGCARKIVKLPYLE